MPSLEVMIRAWDGKSAADIAAVFEHVRGQKGLLDALIESIADPELERGATWLLKRALENDLGPLSDPQSDRFFQAAAGCEDWGARLHAMQMMPALRVPARRATAVAGMLDRGLSDRRAIVRAWAYTGYHELAKAVPRYRSEADNVLADGQASESAGSVRVRIRLALEELSRRAD